MSEREALGVQREIPRWTGSGVGASVSRQLRVTLWVLGLSVIPAPGAAVTLFHSATDQAADRTPLPDQVLRVPQGSSATLNLWVDLDPNDTIFGIQLLLTSSGSLTFDLACVLPCITNPVDPTGGIMQVNLFRGDIVAGDLTPFKIGTFSIRSDGALGDGFRLDSGEYSTAQQVIVVGTSSLAVVAACNNTDCSEGCGDVNEDGIFATDDVDGLRLQLANPGGGVLGPGGLARCAVAGGPVGCDIRQVVVMRRALADPALPPGLAPVCDCCIAGSSPGCSDPETQSCVCAIDGVCCSTAWDATCVSRVDDAGCGACP